MGMFDTIIFKCPNCGEQIEEQTKAGDCGLCDYDASAVPANIAIAMESEVVHCPACENSFIIACENQPKTVSLKLIHPAKPH